jgi:hypothetical protein
MRLRTRRIVRVRVQDGGVSNLYLDCKSSRNGMSIGDEKRPKVAPILIYGCPSGRAKPQRYWPDVLVKAEDL